MQAAVAFEASPALPTATAGGLLGDGATHAAMPDRERAGERSMQLDEKQAYWHERLHTYQQALDSFESLERNTTVPP